MSLRQLLGLTFLAACVMGFTTTSETWADKDGTGRPFKGSGVGIVVDQIPPNGLVLEWVGTATHLGAFTRTEYVFFNADGVSFQGNMIFEAANGDLLYLDFSGAFETPTDAFGTYTFSGGTGRFEDASGEADFHAYTDDLINATVTFEGTINY